MGLIVTTAVPKNARAAEVDRGWAVSILILCGILGMLLGISFKAQHQIQKYHLPAANYDGLAQEYLTVKDTNAQQQRTIKAQNQLIDSYESAGLSTNTRVGVMLRDLQNAKFLAGLTDVSGPGIVVTLNDSKKRFPDNPDIQLAVMIHDSDINAVVNELKAAGAEAISINDERFVSTTAARCAGPTVFVNNTPQTPPYVIQAIGKPDTLDKALRLPLGVFDTISNMDPSMINIVESNKLTIPAYAGPTQPIYAKPVVGDAGSGD